MKGTKLGPMKSPAPKTFDGYPSADSARRVPPYMQKPVVATALGTGRLRQLFIDNGLPTARIRPLVRIPLEPSEARHVELMATGHSMQEIADEMVPPLDERQIKSDRTRILRRLRATNAVHAVRNAYQEGVLDRDPIACQPNALPSRWLLALGLASYGLTHDEIAASLYMSHSRQAEYALDLAADSINAQFPEQGVSHNAPHLVRTAIQVGVLAAHDSLPDVDSRLIAHGVHTLLEPRRPLLSTDATLQVWATPVLRADIATTVGGPHLTRSPQRSV